MTYPLERVQRLVVPVPQPAPGADWALTPTGLGGWRILSLVATLATSAAAGTRSTVLTADDQTNVWFRVPLPSTQAASLTHRISAFNGSSIQGLIGSDMVLDWPDGGLYLPEGNFLRSVTTAIDAGDQWSAIVALVEELPTGPFTLTTPVEPFQQEVW